MDHEALIHGDIPADFHACCVAYELHDRRGPHAIREFLATWEHSSGSRRQLLIELLLVDLDHYWHSQNPQVVVAASSALPLYLETFPEVAQESKALKALIRYEFSCLIDFGFRPKVSQVLRIYPELPGLLRDLRMAFEESTDHVIQVNTGAIEYQTHLGFDEIEVGRQRSSESAPIGEVYGEKLRRIVIAPLHETRISRQHFHVFRTKDDQLRISNTSRRSELLLEGDIVKPNESALRGLPCEVIVGDGVRLSVAKR